MPRELVDPAISEPSPSMLLLPTPTPFPRNRLPPCLLRLFLVRNPSRLFFLITLRTRLSLMDGESFVPLIAGNRPSLDE